MAAVLSPASLSVQTTSESHANSSAKKRPLSPPRPLDEVPDVSAEDLTTPRPTAGGGGGGSVSPKNESVAAIDPHQLKLLKVIGRGTFARQVALARHSETQSMYVVKTLDKSKLVQRKQVVHTLAEKKVLEKLGGHPFIVKLYSSFQTDRDLNFVLEYCQGGELFFHLQQQFSQKFDENTTRFYAAEVLAALSELHSNGVVYRDLKPENVLLDAQGHVKLADFGFAKQDMGPGQRTYSFCGSPEYLSPEMVKKNGHGMETDMWSFGCFIYELLTGSPPFQCDDMHRLFRLIQQGRVWYPPYLSGHAMSLLKGLLCVNPASRLTAAQAMEHPFFTLSLNWDELVQRQVTPPIVPVCHGCDCTDNFDDDFTNAPVASLKLQSGDLVKRVRRDDCSCPIGRADEFQDF
ncbi:AGC protein kinase [Phytophthora nicotianae P10297]|uniref:AGC protein kinase n=4 Tax=Phytophthora nicotianae TaxID=4792 RepID=W2QW56_PHYN3|nr:AGC protein kinase [Phytophthora nicotianae INRA-310]ETI32916.1 AGC protein kinase [Phytophthora nicotianae P1569]ETK73257.1 AGC protein kinase [Phytophthora nicotianae]ETP30923.1 AGC protein kinase [Phytophthora nicotianae P10297]KUF76896.1 RAC family serine/threonine-protein kinase [Phytophthora nicotianae]ETL26694.1 AGC protein kinase [Phytophthora nicotianae]